MGVPAAAVPAPLLHLTGLVKKFRNGCKTLMSLDTYIGIKMLLNQSQFLCLCSGGFTNTQTQPGHLGHHHQTPGPAAGVLPMQGGGLCVRQSGPDSCPRPTGCLSPRVPGVHPAPGFPGCWPPAARGRRIGPRRPVPGCEARNTRVRAAGSGCTRLQEALLEGGGVICGKPEASVYSYPSHLQKASEAAYGNRRRQNTRASGHREDGLS